MTDIVSITAALNGLKTAIDIAKGFRDSDVTYEKAEVKLKLAEMMSALADAKMSIADTAEIIENKDKEIKSLREALDAKKGLIRKNELYYETDASGNVTGDPYCGKCWEIDHEQVHVLMHHYRKHWTCPNCEAVVYRH